MYWYIFTGGVPDEVIDTPSLYLYAEKLRPSGADRVVDVSWDRSLRQQPYIHTQG
jgi:hypothetical protein